MPLRRRHSDHDALARLRKRPCRLSCGTATMSLGSFRAFEAQVFVAMRERRFTAEQRSELWQGTHDQHGPDALKKFLRDTEAIILRHTQQRKESKASEWLPLSVWAHRGFDTDRIERLARSREDPVLGKVYQVTITTSERSSQETREVEHRLEKSSSSHSRGGGEHSQEDDPAPLPAAPEPLPIAGGEMSEKMLRQQVSLAGRILSKLGVVTLPLQVGVFPFLSISHRPCSRQATMSLR